MARDYLPIQGSSVTAERAFSSSGITGTDRRNQLDPKIFEGLQLLKHAYKANTISASEEVEAKEHISNEAESFWADLNLKWENEEDN